jgi:hypothetical protein
MAVLVICGTAASIGGNVAHAHPDLVARAIAAAIPLAVLAMLKGLKGDAGEVTRLTAQAATLDNPAAGLDGPGRRRPATVDTIHIRRTLTPDLDLDRVRPDGQPTAALAARPTPADRSGVRQRLQAAYLQGRPDGQAWTARTLAKAAGCGRSSAVTYLQTQRTPVLDNQP